jgi:hypothetical protein
MLSMTMVQALSEMGLSEESPDRIEFSQTRSSKATCLRLQ